MRISFIKPSTSGALGLEMLTFAEPLGLECVAGAVELEGHQCQIVDMRIDGTTKGLEKVRGFGPDIIGIQCNFTTERFRTQKLVDRLREEFPDAAVVLGGHDASRDPEWFRMAGVDAVALGDGEEIMPAVVRAVEHGSSLQSVPGLMINAPDGPLYTGPAPARCDINDLPLPSRDHISDYRNDYYMHFLKPLALLETSRGCPFKCRFCSVWKFHKGTFREKSAERVMRELTAIDSPYVFITDDIFWVNRRRDSDLADAIIASGIRKHFFIQARTDIIVKFPELIEKWTRCGRLSVFLGLEKVDDEGLSSVNKKNSAANNDRAIDILKDMDAGYTPNFIIDPSWDREDFDKLHRWIDRTGSYNSAFSVLTPLPGTDLWDEVEGNLTTRDWELFDLEHTVLPTRLSLEDFYKEYAGLWHHVLDLRYKARGRLQTHLKLIAALATRRVTYSAVRKGVMVSKVLSRPAKFLTDHKESARRSAAG